MMSIMSCTCDSFQVPFLPLPFLLLCASVFGILGLIHLTNYPHHHFQCVIYPDYFRVFFFYLNHSRPFQCSRLHRLYNMPHFFEQPSHQDFHHFWEDSDLCGCILVSRREYKHIWFDFCNMYTVVRNVLPFCFHTKHWRNWRELISSVKINS